MVKSVKISDETAILLNKARSMAIDNDPSLKATDEAVIKLALMTFLAESP